MDKVNDSFEGFLGGEHDKISVLSEPSLKTHIKRYVLENPNKVVNCLLRSRNVESQIAILTMLTKLFTKEEIVKNNVLCNENLSVGISQIPRSNKNRLLGFINDFNHKENSRVIGAQVEQLELGDKVMRGGFIFIGDQSLRIQERNDVIVVFFKSVRDLRMEGTTIAIEASEGKKISIRLRYNQDLTKFQSRIEELFYQAEAQDSIVLEIGKRVTFSQELNNIEKFPNYVDNSRVKESTVSLEPQEVSGNPSCNSLLADSCSLSLSLDGDGTLIKNKIDNDYNPLELSQLVTNSGELSKKSPSSVDLRVNGLCNTSSTLGSEMSQSLVESDSIGSVTWALNEENAIKSNHKGKKFYTKIPNFKRRRKNPHKKIKNFKKSGHTFKSVPVFRKLNAKVSNIYKSKVQLAELVFKKMKEEARLFKKAMEKLSNSNVNEMKIK